MFVTNLFHSPTSACLVFDVLSKKTAAKDAQSGNKTNDSFSPQSLVDQANFVQVCEESLQYVLDFQ